MSASDAPQQANDDKTVVYASGEKSVAISGDAKDTMILTGDHATVAPTIRMFWLIGFVLAVAVIIVLGFIQQHVHMTTIENRLLSAVVRKPLFEGQTKPDPLPPELIKQAKLLLEEGNPEQKALAKIVLKRPDEANRIIQKLKAQPGNPIDKAFRLLTLEGDNWYQVGEFDKAIEPYETAMALQLKDFKVPE